jgi:thioredoxin 1
MTRMAIASVTESEFKLIVASKGTVLVDFWAPWCVHCKKMSAVIEELQEDPATNFTIVAINADEQPEIATEHRVMSLPTLVVYKDGIAVNKTVGVQSKEAVISLLKRYTS